MTTTDISQRLPQERTRKVSVISAMNKRAVYACCFSYFSTNVSISDVNYTNLICVCETSFGCILCFAPGQIGSLDFKFRMNESGFCAEFLGALGCFLHPP